MFLFLQLSLINFNAIVELRPPTIRNKPVDVDFSMRVVDINSINVEDMDFRYVPLFKD